jgi:iron complex transport system substrate-binding protein
MMAALVVACEDAEYNVAGTKHPRRIISFAPSITETLFALGLGDRVVAVTSFCDYPPAARELPRVGGYMDPGYEMIVRLEPDLVVLMTEHTVVQRFLRAREIPFLRIDNHDIEGIIESFRLIGERCGRSQAADSLARRVRTELAAAWRDTTVVRPRVLLCVGRDNAGSGKISRVYAAGRTTFYDELLRAAGGVNAYPDAAIQYPHLSAEGVAAMAPDIIIDMMASMDEVSAGTVRADWDHLTIVPAVRSGMVFCLTGKHLTIPGPRIVTILRDLRRIVEEWHRAIKPAKTWAIGARRDVSPDHSRSVERRRRGTS